MMKMIRACHLFVVCATLVVSAKCDEELLSVVTIYRHGDRTPIYSYPTDPYDASYWPIGYGQLTNEGKERHFKLGQWVRERYDGFLSRNYNLTEIRVQSTDVDRTLMSAQAHLAGLYPPTDDQVWNDQLLWQPIPVHTISQVSDILLIQNTDGCNKYNRLREELLGFPDLQNLYRQNKDLFEYVQEYAQQNITTFEDLFLFFDTLHVEKLNNLTLPDWAENIYERLVNVSDLGLSLYSWTPDLAKLKAGRLIYEILNQFDKISTGVQTQKFIMYSAHDSTLVNVLNALGVFDGVLPTYTSMLLFELKRDGNGTFLDIWYKRGGEVIKNLSLDICGSNCNLHRTKNILESVLIASDADWLDECNS